LKVFEDSFCPGCIVQSRFYLTDGITDLRNVYQYCVDNVKLLPEVYDAFVSGSFIAPTTPGLYYFGYYVTLEYSCDDVSFPARRCSDSAWAMLCVKGDSDGDSIDDCFDNCPCVFNPNQEDSDLDGIGDLCPLVKLPNTFEYYEKVLVDCEANETTYPVATLRNDSCGISPITKLYLDTSIYEESVNTSICHQYYKKVWTFNSLCDCPECNHTYTLEYERGLTPTTNFVTSAPITTSSITTSPITTSPITTSPITTSPISTSPITTSLTSTSADFISNENQNLSKPSIIGLSVGIPIAFALIILLFVALAYSKRRNDQSQNNASRSDIELK